MLVKTGGGGEGGVGLPIPEAGLGDAGDLEGTDDAGTMGVAGEQSIDTVCRLPVQGTIVKKRRGRMMESVDRENRIKCEINLIGGALSEMGPLARMMGPNSE